MSETIVPEVKLDNLQAELIAFNAKSVAAGPVVELKIQVPISHRLNWDSLSKLLRRPSRLTLLDDQLTLPVKSPSHAGDDVPVADGQLSIHDINADAQLDGPEPVKYSLLLLELPTEEKQLKAAKKWLRKFTGLRAADLDVELEALAAGAGYLVIEGGNEPYVMETKLEMERLGMVVSIHAWEKAGEVAETPAEVAPDVGTVSKVTIDQLVVGSQWILKGIGTQVRIHSIVGEKVYFHSLYALYSNLPAWVFAAAVTPAEPLAELEAVDLAMFENVPAKKVQLDPETEKRLAEGPWLMPVVELPMDATVIYKGKRWVIVDVAITDGRPVVILDNGSEDVSLPVGAYVQPESASMLSPIVFHAIAETQQEAQEGASNSPDDQTQHGAKELSKFGELDGNDEGLDPTPSTAVSDGGDGPVLSEVRDAKCVICGQLFASHTSLSPNTCAVCLNTVGGSAQPVEDEGDEQEAA